MSNVSPTERFDSIALASEVPVTDGLEDLTVPQLKDELRKRNLRLGGNKGQLVTRLRAAIRFVEGNTEVETTAESSILDSNSIDSSIELSDVETQIPDEVLSAHSLEIHNDEDLSQIKVIISEKINPFIEKIRSELDPNIAGLEILLDRARKQRDDYIEPFESAKKFLNQLIKDFKKEQKRLAAVHAAEMEAKVEKAAQEELDRMRDSEEYTESELKIISSMLGSSEEVLANRDTPELANSTGTDEVDAVIETQETVEVDTSEGLDEVIRSLDELDRLVDQVRQNEAYELLQPLSREDHPTISGKSEEGPEIVGSKKTYSDPVYVWKLISIDDVLPDFTVLNEDLIDLTVQDLGLLAADVIGGIEVSRI
jgi:hypothetical protein